MAHGYLGDGYGIHGDFDEDRDETERRWRSRYDESRDRDRGTMFGGWDRSGSDDRWSDRTTGREGYGRERGFGGPQGDFRRGRELGGFGDRHEGRRFSAHQDDHYRSWRDRHMSDLDRDYEDYCREREQQFHQDFSTWRSQRHGNPQPLRTGMTQTGMSHDPSGERPVANEATAADIEPDPMGDATLGTTSSGRKGR